ncbi:MAG: hypothetical protein RSE38_10170 [Acinetobacter sp.]
MSELISGKEALIALANGEDVEYFDEKLNEFVYMDMTHHFNRKFRLRPRTITINGIEVPAPFEPKDGEDCRAYVIDTRNVNGYDWQHSSHYKSGYIVWRTESEIKQVVAALRSVFKPQ